MKGFCRMDRVKPYCRVHAVFVFFRNLNRRARSVFLRPNIYKRNPRLMRAFYNILAVFLKRCEVGMRVDVYIAIIHFRGKRGATGILFAAIASLIFSAVTGIIGSSKRAIRESSATSSEIIFCPAALSLFTNL